MSIRITSDNAHIHIHGESEVDLFGTREKTESAIGIKSGTDVIYVKSDVFYQGVGQVLHESCPDLKLNQCIEAVRSHLEEGNCENIDDLENWINLMKSRVYLMKGVKHKGEAYRSAIEALSKSVETGKLITTVAKSQQKVYLTEEAAFKQSHPRALTEEEQIDGLMSILLPDSIVPQKRMKEIASERYGFTPRDLLNKEERDRLFHYNPAFKVRFDSASRRIIKDIDLKECEVLPVFSSQEEEANYRFCEAVKWEYLDPKTEEWETVTFHKLHELYISCRIHADTSLRKAGEETAAPCCKNQAVQSAFNCHMRIVPPMLIRDFGKISPLANSLVTVAKPMVHNMILFDELKQNEILYQTVFQQLSPESEMKALFTLDMQFMDLHGNNIGFTPSLQNAYLDFHYTYSTSDKHIQKNVPFTFLIADYFNDNIDLTKDAKIVDRKGNPVAENLEEVIDKVLDCKWEIVLFDTDQSLGENNTFNTLKEMHYVPLKSVLLQTKWKDRELSPEALKQLKEMEKRIPQALSWLSNENSFQMGMIKDKELFQKEISKYNFGNEMGKNGKSLDQLREEFANNIADNDALWIPNLSKKERVKIAKQLFPRATVKQQEAYRERILKRRELFANHEKWKKGPTDQEIEKLLPLLPLTTFEKGAYTAIFKKLRDNDFKLEKQYIGLFEELQMLAYPSENFRKAFIELMGEKTKPTYFNIAKAMYPMLADAYLLGENNRKNGGLFIGIRSFEEETYYLKQEPSLPIQSAIAHFSSMTGH